MNSNILEFYVKIKDMMSGGLAKIAQNSQNTFTKIKSNIANATASTKFMSHSVDELREKLRRVNEVRFGTVMKSEFNQASRSARQLETQIARMESRGSRRGGGLLSMAASYIGPLAIAAGLMSFGKGSIGSAMDFGATKKSFEVLTGSKSTGNGLANNLNKLQQDTILGPEVFKAAQTMMGFGIASKEVEKDIKRLGDISMGNTDRFNQLTLAFSQTRAAGRLMGQDLLQYINAGFNPLQTMSEHWKEFGFTAQKSVGDLKAAMEKGLITSDMVSMAIDIATSKGGKYFDMMNQMATTPYGKLKMLQGQWEALKIKTGEALMPLAEMLMKLATLLIKHKEYIVAIGTAWAAFKIVSTASMMASSTAATAALGPLGLVAIAVGAIALAWTQASGARERYEQFKENAKNAAFSAETKSISDDVAALQRNGRTLEEAVKEAKTVHMNFTLDEMRKNGMELQEKTRVYSDLKERGLEGFIPKELKDRIELLQTAQDNWGAKRDAASAYSATDIQSGVIPPPDPDKNKPGKSVASSIAGGGPRVININGVKFTDKIEMHVATMGEGIDQIESKFEEMFLRILNSGASVQN